MDINNDVRTIRSALKDGLRLAETRLERSYGRSLDARDQEWHSIRGLVADLRKAVAALDRISAHIRNLPMASQPDDDAGREDCTCHLLGETCGTCNDRYREDNEARQ